MSNAPPPFLRDFSRKAAQLGFIFSGYTGTNHPKYYNAAVDATVTTALTPSDYRGQRNAISDMERLSGRKLPRDNSGHHRWVKVKSLNTQLSEVERQTLERVNELLDEAEYLQDQWHVLVAGPANRTAVAEAREVMERYEQVRHQLESLHRVIPPLAVA